MKKTILLPLAIASLLLGGCTSSPKKKSSKGGVTSEGVSSKENASSSVINPSSNQGITSQVSPSSGGGTSLNPTSQGGASSSVNPSSYPTPIESDIIGINILDKYIEGHVGKKVTATPLLDFVYKEGVDGDKVDHSVTWNVLDSTIADVDFAGRITGLKRGKTKLTVETEVGHCVASCDVYVFNENEYPEEKLLKIENTEINVGDDLIIANAEYGVAAGEDCTGGYLHPVSVTFNSSKTEITNYGEAAYFKVLEDKKGREGFVLEDPDRDGNKFLGTSNVSNVDFYASNNTTQTIWDIDWDNEQSCWDMRASSNTTVDGWMMYNSQHEKFTTYEKGVSSVLHSIDIYRLTIIIDL